MTQTDNSLTNQLETVNRYHANAVKLANGYLKALTSENSEVSVEIENLDGSKSTINIPSNIALSNQLKLLTQSFKNLSDLSETQSTIVSTAGTFREIFVTSHRRTLPALTENDIVVDQEVKLSTNAIVEQLLSPLTEVELTLPASYSKSRQTRIKKFIITDGDFSVFSNGMTYAEVRKTLSTGEYTWSSQEYDKANQSNDSRFYGDFDVIASEVTEAGKLKLILNKLQYSDQLNIVENSKRLDIGDSLTSTDGSLRLSVSSVDVKTMTIICDFDAGVGSITPGEAKLSILSTEPLESKIRIPVRLQEKSIIFINPIDNSTGIAASNSTSQLFDSTKFTVVQNGETYLFNEFFSSKVADIGTYFESIVRESLIPATLGEVPNQPELSENDFQVVQINSHLTNTPDAKKLKKLQQEKDVVNGQISALNTSIATLNTKIAQGNYSTEAKRINDQALLQSKIGSKLQKTSLLSSLVADMSTILNNTAEKASIKPKYRVRGFWPVQTDIPSALTNPQKIVQYQARYRYVANTGNTANATQITYTENGNKVSAAFTPWQIVKTEALERIIDENGEAKWLPNSPTDANKANINQIDIPIQFGESAELQVRAITEAGWPTSPVMSEWSNLVRLNFPVELLQESDNAAFARKNNDDTVNVRIQQEFANQGITEHISKSIREQDKYFAHEAKEIASGHVTSEQKIISMFEYTGLLENRIKFLEEKVDRRYATITAQLVDEQHRIYDVNHFSTIKMFAGYYTDSVDLSDPANYGSIVEKTFYLRLMNRNAQTVEMLSISPGPLIQNTGSILYENVPIFLAGSNSTGRQQNGQIFYNRNIDINGTVALYNDEEQLSLTAVSATDIDSSAIDAQRNIVHMSSTLIETVRLIDSASLEGYVAMTTNHPAYVDFAQTGNSELLKQEFERIKYFNKLYRQDFMQNQLSENLILGYQPDDRYLVGRNSVGATAFTELNSIESFQVNGIDAGSSKEIYSGEQDSILIPIKFQYRMTDALGNPDGQSSATTNTNFEYTKKLGIDILVSGKKFTFDIQINAKFRPTSASNNTLGIQPVGSITTTQPNID